MEPINNSQKKSYNPFKMWGSWIGLAIGLILLFIPYSISASNLYEQQYNSYINQLDCVDSIDDFGNEIQCVEMSKPNYLRILFSEPSRDKAIPLTIRIFGYNYFSIYVHFLLPILSFLVGWGIHSLIRRFRK